MNFEILVPIGIILLVIAQSLGSIMIRSRHAIVESRLDCLQRVVNVVADGVKVLAESHRALQDKHNKTHDYVLSEREMINVSNFLLLTLTDIVQGRNPSDDEYMVAMHKSIVEIGRQRGLIDSEEDDENS